MKGLDFSKDRTNIELNLNEESKSRLDMSIFENNILTVKKPEEKSSSSNLTKKRRKKGSKQRSKEES